MNLRTILCGAAMAAAVTLPGLAIAEPIWTMTRDYGIGDSKVNPLLAGFCDTLNTDSVTIRNANGCQRFADVFDFGDLIFDAIDRFEVTLTYNETNNGELILEDGEIVVADPAVGYEFWAMRPASSLTVGSSVQPFMTRVGAQPVSQLFTIDSEFDVFDTIVNDQQFFLWMSHLGAGQQEFNLFSATVNIFGTTPTSADVSAPGSLALLGMGTALLGLRRRRKALK